MYKLIVYGDPPYRELRVNNGGWNNWKLKRANYLAELGRQQLPIPICIGPIYVRVMFYLKIKSKKSHQVRNASGYYSASTPSLPSLMDFACDMLVGLAINKKVSIAKIEAEKKYDENPRTEFYIEKLSCASVG